MDFCKNFAEFSPWKIYSEFIVFPSMYCESRLVSFFTFSTFSFYRGHMIASSSLSCGSTSSVQATEQLSSSSLLLWLLVLLPHI